MSGRKLIDGTPFGRTFLRPAPDRPALTARPAKRRRIEDDSIAAELEPEDDESYTEEDEETETEDSNSENDEEAVKERQIIPARRSLIQNRKYPDENGAISANMEQYHNPLMDLYCKETIDAETEFNKEEELKRTSEGRSPNFEEEKGSPTNVKRLSAAEIITADVDSSDSSDDDDYDPRESSDSSSDGDDEHEDDQDEDGDVDGDESRMERAMPIEKKPTTQEFKISDIIAPSEDESSDSDFDPQAATAEVQISDEVYSSPEPSSSSSSEEEEEEEEEEDRADLKPRK
jgi:hypothetical protein